MSKPYFLWDYNLDDEDAKKILRQGDEYEKRWLVARILEHAHFRDVFDYLTAEDISEIFSKLKLRPATKRYWQRALNAWGYDVEECGDFVLTDGQKSGL